MPGYLDGFINLARPREDDGTAVLLHGGEYSRGHLAEPFLMMFGNGRLLRQRPLQLLRPGGP
jgi:hypothetical protein